METQFERKLIFEDENLAREIVSDLQQFKPLLYKLKEAFEKLDIGKFTNTDLKILGVSGTARYEKLFIESINQQLGKAGLKSEFLRETIMKDNQKLLDELTEARENLKRFRPSFYTAYGRPPLELMYISFSKVFFIDDGDLEEIKERYCRVYLETPEQAEGWEVLTALSEKYNEFLDKIELLNYNTSLIMSFNFLNTVLHNAGNNRVKPSAGGFIAVATRSERDEQHRKSREQFRKELNDIEVNE